MASRVQETGRYEASTSLTSHSLPITNLPSVGNTLVAVVTISGADTFGTITDPRGNTWAKRTSAAGGTSLAVAIYDAAVSNAYQAGDSVTLNLSASRPAAAIITEVTGVGAFDVAASAASGTSGNSWDSGATSTTTQADEYVAALLGVVATVNSPAPTDANYTAEGTGASSSGTVRSAYYFDQVVSATGAQQFAGSWNGSKRQWGAAVATYKGAATSISGSGGVTFAHPALAGAGTNTPPAITGTGAVVLAAPALAASGAETFSGTGAASIAAPSLAGTAKLTFAGSGALAIAAPVLSATGTNTPPAVTGTGAVAFAVPTLAGTGSAGSSAVTGTGAVAFAHPVLAANGAETFAGSGSVALAAPALAATAALSFSGTGGVSIAAPSIRGYQAAPDQTGPPRGSLTLMGLGG